MYNVYNNKVTKQTYRNQGGRPLYKRGDWVVIPSNGFKEKFQIYSIKESEDIRVPHLYILKKKAPAAFFETELL